jgi:hypothetical protein
MNTENLLVKLFNDGSFAVNCNGEITDLQLSSFGIPLFLDNIQRTYIQTDKLSIQKLRNLLADYSPVYGYNNADIYIIASIAGGCVNVGVGEKICNKL